jgi:hypothetical protein
MSDKENEKRIAKRHQSAIELAVKGRKSKDFFWKETTETINISRLGTNFTLDRPCPPGRLLSLELNMPQNFRCYDWDKDVYQVWAVVQHCQMIFGTDSYQIGVAFVGKNAPKSYRENPSKAYKISGLDADGFWNIREDKIPFVTRNHQRFPRSLKTRIAFIDAQGKETEVDENAVTEDISVGGTAVFSDLRANTGDCVRFTCPEYDFSSLCVVRNRQIREIDDVILNLSFSEEKFPVENLPPVSEDALET